MSHCQHCGGLVGRDCFNVEECGAITQEIERQGMIDAELEPLRAQLEAERAAHAAEVNWYRRALSEIEGMTAGGKGQSVVNLIAQHALAAPPTAAVEAVEGMRKALEERHAATCQSILLDCDCGLGRRQRAALAAYEEATRG